MNFWKDLIAVFFPELCFGCGSPLGSHERICCIECLHDLPTTNFSSEKENLVEQCFYGRIPLISGSAMFYYFKKGIVQQLIYQLKYKGQQQIGEFIGLWLAEELILSERFQEIDAIIPVPLHKRKFKKRGYNQVTVFGKTLSEKLHVPYYSRQLERISYSKSQTKKFRFDRWKNVQELFVVNNPSFLKNMHILLIDDIITTGATLEACYEALKAVPGIKISIACMAYTK